MSPENSAEQFLDRVLPIQDADTLREYDIRLDVLRGVEMPSLTLSYMIAPEEEFLRLIDAMLNRQQG